MSKNTGNDTVFSFRAFVFIVPLFPTFRNILVATSLICFLSYAQDAAIEGVETASFPLGQHQDGKIDYEQHPPMGGFHHPGWLNCGIYDRAIETEKAVHSLEHGAVWIAYAPTLPAAQVEALKNLLRKRTYTLLAPYTRSDLETPIVAVAWGVRLEVETASDPRLKQFVQTYANGPQTPEPGAPCSGGVGSPLE
jgi:hypothetical protein